MESGRESGRERAGGRKETGHRAERADLVRAVEASHSEVEDLVGVLFYLARVARAEGVLVHH
eukprot:scaffold158633_cov23-Tisochrysis_lutea.AAC.1